ncbi:hypothetical protein D3C80_1586140 [compost metagenome]
MNEGIDAIAQALYQNSFRLIRHAPQHHGFETLEHFLRDTAMEILARAILLKLDPGQKANCIKTPGFGLYDLEIWSGPNLHNLTNSDVF